MLFVLLLLRSVFKLSIFALSFCMYWLTFCCWLSKLSMVCCFNIFSSFASLITVLSCFVCTDINFFSSCSSVILSCMVSVCSSFWVSVSCIIAFSLYKLSMHTSFWVNVFCITVFSLFNVSSYDCSCDNVSMLAIITTIFARTNLLHLFWIFTQYLLENHLGNFQVKLMCMLVVQCIRNEPMIYIHNTVAYV